MMGAVFEGLARLVVGFIGVFGLNLLLLTGAHAAWELYASTGTGDRFQEMSPEVSDQIIYLMGQPKLEYTLDVSLVVLALILPAALLAQFFRLRHYVYSPMPFFIKGGWALLAAYFIAEALQPHLGITYWGVAYASVLPAALCLLPLCLNVADRILPDMFTMVLRTKEWLEDR